VIRTFKDKGLKELFERGRTNRINPQHKARCLRILDALEAAHLPQDMNIPGFYYHSLTNVNPATYSVRVTGNYRIIFEWDGQDAKNIDYVDYH
jgi:proteic killer suppression protein